MVQKRLKVLIINQGTGFLIKGIANFIETGEDFDMMKEKYPFLRKVLEVKVESAKQLL